MERQTRAHMLSQWSRRWETDVAFRERSKQYYKQRYARETAKRQRWAYLAILKQGKIRVPREETLRRHGLLEWWAEWTTTSSNHSGMTENPALDLPEISGNRPGDESP